MLSSADSKKKNNLNSDKESVFTSTKGRILLTRNCMILDFSVMCANHSRLHNALKNEIIYIPFELAGHSMFVC